MNNFERREAANLILRTKLHRQGIYLLVSSPARSCMWRVMNKLGGPVMQELTELMPKDTNSWRSRRAMKVVIALLAKQIYVTRREGENNIKIWFEDIDGKGIRADINGLDMELHPDESPPF